MSSKSKGVLRKFFPSAFLLLFIAVAVFLPLEAAKAGKIIPTFGEVIGSFVSFDLFSTVVDFTAKLIKGDSAFMTFIYFLIYKVVSLGLYLTTVLVYFGSWLIDVFLDEDIYASVLNMSNPTSAVSIGWTTVRDACNTFFILFLLLIAFSTILRIQTYSAKNLLPKLIISLFLINFSATIAMIVIDFGQVFMFEIKNWMGAGGFSEGGGPLTSIVDYFNREYGYLRETPDEGYLMSDVVGVTFAVVYSAVLGLLYIMLALFLIVRIVVFVVLVIISPFAFFSIILPGMRTYTSQWWSSLVSHAIFGPIFLFFIFLSGKMAQSMQTFDSPVPEPKDIEPLSYIIAKLIPHVVAMGMLIAAIPVTQKLGLAGSSKIIGGTAGLGKIGIGVVAGSKLVGGLGKKIGGGIDRRTGGRMSDWGRKGKEEILLKLPGGKGEVLKERAKTEREREENMKKIRIEFGEAKSRDLDLLHEKAKSRLATKEDRALFAETAIAQGKSGDATYAGDIAKFMPEIERTLSGKELSEITDKNLDAALETSKNRKRISDAKDGDYSSFNDDAKKRLGDGESTAEEEIKREMINDLVEDGNTHKIQDLGSKTTAKMYNEVVSNEQKKSDRNRMSKKQLDELAKGYMENTLSAADYATANAEQKKVDLKYKAEAVNVGKELTKAFASGGTDAAKDIEKAFSKFDSKRIAKFTEDELRTHGYGANSSQLRSLNRDGKQDEIKIIRESKETKMYSSPIGSAEREKYKTDVANIDSMISGDKY